MKEKEGKKIMNEFSLVMQAVTGLLMGLAVIAGLIGASKGISEWASYGGKMRTYAAHCKKQESAEEPKMPIEPGSGWRAIATLLFLVAFLTGCVAFGTGAASIVSPTESGGACVAPEAPSAIETVTPAPGYTAPAPNALTPPATIEGFAAATEAPNHLLDGFTSGTWTQVESLQPGWNYVVVYATLNKGGDYDYIQTSFILDVNPEANMAVGPGWDGDPDHVRMAFALPGGFRPADLKSQACYTALNIRDKNVIPLSDDVAIEVHFGDDKGWQDVQPMSKYTCSQAQPFAPIPTFTPAP